MHRFQRWRETLQGAKDAQHVQRIMKEYVDVIGPALIAVLPPECQRALAEADIQSAAVTLLLCELNYHGDPQIAELLHEIAHTFAAAATRTSRLGREPLVPSGG